MAGVSAGGGLGFALRSIRAKKGRLERSTTMKRITFGVLTAFILPLACGNPEDLGLVALDQQALLATTDAVPAEVFKIGVVISSEDPAHTNYLAAINLAKNQVNQGLQQAGSPHRFELVVAPYTGFGAGPVAVDLINNQDVLAIVADNNQAAADVNRLNQIFGSPTVKEVPVTCYLCSSVRFNTDGETDPGFADTEGWLSRTFYNTAFEGSMHVRFLRAKAHGGDFNRDGHLKVVVYFDSDYDLPSFNFPFVFDSMFTGAHSSKLVLRSSNPQADLDQILDTAPDGRAPDYIFVNAMPDAGLPLLTAYKNRAGSKPPIAVNNEYQRDHRVPAILATGLTNLEGSGFFRLAKGDSGNLFKNAFVSATSTQPDYAASYAYDSTVMLMGAIGWAFHFGSLDPAVIQGNIFNVNDLSGRMIRPRVPDYKLAAQLINNEQPINYEGASSSMDIDFRGDHYPDLVRWKISSGKIAEQEVYRCPPFFDIAVCTRQ